MHLSTNLTTDLPLRFNYLMIEKCILDWTENCSQWFSSAGTGGGKQYSSAREGHVGNSREHIQVLKIQYYNFVFKKQK